MNDVLKPFKLKRVYRFEKHELLNELVQSIEANKDDSFLIHQITNVVLGIKDYKPNQIIKLLVPKGDLLTDDNRSITDTSDRVRKTRLELQDAINISKAIQTGFLYDERKNKYQFNANLFAEYFLQRVVATCDKNGILYLYNNKGVYKEFNNVELGKLVRTLMNEGLRNSWRVNYEKEAIQAIQRECRYVEEFNQFNEYINLENGMFNLTTGILEKHHPRYLSTIQVPVHYNPKAKCPRFIEFMKEITLNDRELIRVHQELIGYWLSSETKCEKAVYYYGRGANGKSVLANIVSLLVGKENVSSIPLAQFSQSFGLEGIIGKTLNIAAENEMQGSKLNTEAFKSIVSGDGLTINIKYRPPIVNYKSKCRLLFLGNELPDTSDLTYGYFRRMMIIPFKRSFSEEERNRSLLDELKEELPGIFNWAVQGLIHLKQQDFIFSNSKVIEEEMQKYHLAQNPVLHFFESVVHVSPSSRIRRPDLYKAFQIWCVEQGIDGLAFKSRQRFFKDIENVLDSKGIKFITKKIQGLEYFQGIDI